MLRRVLAAARRGSPYSGPSSGASGIGGPGASAELLHHRQHVELAPALDDLVVLHAEEVDAPDAHPATGRREAEQLALLPAGDLPEVGDPVALDEHELGRVVELRDRAAEDSCAASISASGPMRPTSKKRVGGWSLKSA